jgi:energy-coupling factor transporter ATP-binding protein EcfA2
LSEPLVRLAKKETLTILLVGETGVGKTSFLSLLINLFSGRGPSELALFHSPSNESNLSRSQSQTNDAFMYQFVSTDGVHVRILDTPGLADTRGIDQDKAHRASIVRAIDEQVKTIDSVVVLANGTQERLSVATEYALSAIGSMFPRSIAGNISFIFTHVPDPLSMNFCSSSLPPAFISCNMWTIQNPIAQYVKYNEYIAANTPQTQREHLWNILVHNYDQTVCTRTAFLKWVDSCKPQPTKAIQELFDMSMAIESKLMNVFARISQQEGRRAELNRLRAELRTSHLVRSTSCLIPVC